MSVFVITHLKRAAAAALLTTAALSPSAAAAADSFDVTVTRTAYGIPHIQAKDFAGVGYGYAYSIAQDNICELADTYLTVEGERSRFDDGNGPLGPEGGYQSRGNGSSATNINSDFFFQMIKDEKRIETLLADDSPVTGVGQDIRAGVRGYAAGYNAFLRDVKAGRQKITDPRCAGKPWVKPISEMTVWRRFYQLALLASSGVAINEIASAQPPGASLPSQLPVAAESLKPGEIDERLGGLGSNAMALGKAATESGKGLLYGNPHFPWEGPERFYQSHITVEDKKQPVDVAGGSLFGVPLILIGHTKNMAWSHTVSTARRFTPFELKLVPGDPTSYLYDGEVRKMRSRTVTIDVLNRDTGQLEKQTRTLYASHHGPILNGILGLPVFPWTPERAYAMGDANDENFGRLFNHFFNVNKAQSVGEVEGILKKYVGIPWVNTVAADSKGGALYADIGSIPNVSDAKLQQCRTPLGVALDTAQRLPVLDGSTAACEWGTDADAPAPGVFGPKNLPMLRRDDHVSNMNDSYWLANPKQPIEGFARIIGEERTVRSLRTRGGLVMHQERLAAGDKFDLNDLTTVSMSNRVYAGELWQEELVDMCRQLPYAPTSGGAPVAVPPAACDALANWKRTDDLDDKGAVLFRRFASRALGAAGGPFDVPFSASDPVNTPRGLNTEHPQVRAALGDAINDLKSKEIPFDAPLRGLQYEVQNGEKIPVHGGPGGTGVYNVITAGWQSGPGHFGDVNHGSSFVQAVELTGSCPKVRTILTYSQSTDPTSPHYTDQDRVYAGKDWVSPPFCAKAVEKAAKTRLTVKKGKRKFAKVKKRKAARKRR